MVPVTQIYAPRIAFCALVENSWFFVENNVFVVEITKNISSIAQITY